MQTTLTGAGQVTLPINIRKELQLVDGDEVYFHIDPIEPLIWISVKNKSDYCSKLLSKGQITIPKRIRNHLRLSTGMIIEFIISESSVYFEVQFDKLPCMICEYEGRIVVGNDKYPCLVCLSTGFYKKEPVMNRLSRLIAKDKRRVGIQLNTNDCIVPTIKFTVSDEYPQELKNRFQDFYQWLFFNEFAKDEMSKNEADTILDLFNTEEYRTLVGQEIKSNISR